ncbi:MAG: hypothetical protein H7Z43_14635 [Clostridia bacterium]|nr:hypothetical protein [Deltaproteobacteria bacterium]
MPTVFADLGDHQATGVAVSQSNRVFVSFPRWSDDVPLSVAEVGNDGILVPYPTAAWNAFQLGNTKEIATQFVCVQSITVDADDHLWILDPASPNLAGVIPHGPKLVEVDLATDRVLRSIAFSPEVAPTFSYLNDVRIDTREHAAYITDSGLGGIIVVDLSGSRARRVLGDHVSAKAEEMFLPDVNGVPVKAIDGTPLRVHSDGIALSRDGSTLYYHALSGRTLYKIATLDLRDVSLPADMLAARVSPVAHTAAADGLEIDPRGRLFITNIESSAISMLDTRASDGTTTLVAQSPLLDWPDSIAIAPDGALLVTASQIERMPRFAGFEKRSHSYQLLRIVLPTDP